jgi:hypothetical protein
MPTGPNRIDPYEVTYAGGTEEHVEKPCICTIGDDHDDSNILRATKAEVIWRSSGMDGDFDLR